MGGGPAAGCKRSQVTVWQGRSMDARSWDDGTWTTPPAAVVHDGSGLLVTAREVSDFWRTTSYGFVHDDGHGLLAPFPDGTAVEVSFVADLTEQFDQAGLLVRADAEHWVKAGVEYADGAAQLGAVVTSVVSDWSTGEVDWVGRTVTVRASRSGDALTVRARRLRDLLAAWKRETAAPRLAGFTKK